VERRGAGEGLRLAGDGDGERLRLAGEGGGLYTNGMMLAKLPYSCSANATAAEAALPLLEMSGGQSLWDSPFNCELA
jgi:hypothetical protein